MTILVGNIYCYNDFTIRMLKGDIVRMAQWIWYPGDFEFYLGMHVMSSRTERGIVIPPGWRIEGFHHSVKFAREFEVEEDTYIKIHSTGTQCVQLDYDWYSHYDPQVGLHVSKGHHAIWIQVFSSTVLPSIFIEGSGMETGEGWTVTGDGRDWKEVGYWDFTTSDTPPTQFKLETRPIYPTEITNVNGGLLYDFGKETMGYVKGKKATGNGRLMICYGESREEDTEECCIVEYVSLDEDTTEFRIPRSQAFRYIYIPNVSKISIGHLSADYEYLPVTNKGAFESDSELLNRIYDVSVRTMHLTTREFFLDGIKRDRWVWSGDATQSYLMNYYSFFDNEVCKRTMRFVRGKDPIATHFNTIQDYTLYWFDSLWQYYLYTGDKQFLKEMYPSACSLMDEFCIPRTDERGFLMADSKDWVFIDWTDIPNMNVGDISFIQLLFAYALKAMADMAEVMHDKIAEVKYRKRFESLMDTIFQVFWSEDMGCFTHGPVSHPSAVVTRYANIFAIILGCLDEEKKQSVIKNVLQNDEVYAITTPYMKFYELLALCEAGMYAETEEYINSYWGGMLSLGCTSFWEKYNPQNTGIEHYAMYGLKYGVSLCHAWGAGPILLFGKYYLGVRPTAPGYEKFIVEPHLIGGQCISGQVPVPNGTIHVRLTQNSVVVENQSKGAGELRIDGMIFPIPAGQRIEVDRISEYELEERAIC